jgi:3-oxoadipate enol-lactonase
MSTVVLCGSLGSTSVMWEPQAEALARRRIVVVEHPGHGGAPADAAADLDGLTRRVLDAADGPFSFIGLSLGGIVGMRVASAFPERIERLVLACTSPSFGDPAQWHARAALVREQGLEVLVDTLMQRWFTPAFGDVSTYREMFLSVDPEGYARCCEIIAGWDGSQDLARVQTPTLVVAGADDPVSPPDHAEAISGLVAGAEVAVIGGAAHLANVERAGEFNRLLEEFL